MSAPELLPVFVRLPQIIPTSTTKRQLQIRIGIRTLQEQYSDQPEMLNEKLQQLHIKIGPNGAKELGIDPGVYNAGALNFGE